MAVSFGKVDLPIGWLGQYYSALAPFTRGMAPRGPDTDGDSGTSIYYIQKAHLAKDNILNEVYWRFGGGLAFIGI